MSPQTFLLRRISQPIVWGETRSIFEMARQIARLCNDKVNAASKRGLYADGGGLYLLVGPTGAKSWVFRYRANGRLRDMGLGAIHTVGLAEARKRAQQHRLARLDGIDPLDLKKARQTDAKLKAAKAMTFKACAEGYMAANRAGWGTRHASIWQQSVIDHAYPVLGDLPVQAVDTALLMRAIQPLWATKTETASRVRGRVEAILDWATTCGHRTGENPARWKGHLENLLPRRSRVVPVKHFAALPYAEIAGLMAELRQREGFAARALEFAILTAARTGEVIGASWDEISLAERLWIVPATRMKGGKEHRVPLSEAAMAVVETMAEYRQGDHLFPGRRLGKPLNAHALWDLLKAVGHAEESVHGFRSSFRDWAAERTTFPAEIPEMALAHNVGSAVQRAYQRSDMFDKRRQLAQAWARYITQPPADGAVVPLHADRPAS
jgi:integrase